MSKTMAEVIREQFAVWDEKGGVKIWAAPAEVADALTAAGFGDVREAGAKALEGAADAREVDTAVGIEMFALGIRHRIWLRDRAAAVRGEG